MTKKDYVAIAQALRDAYGEDHAAFPVSGEEMRQEAAGRLCEAFAADNPRFDRARFLAACGIES